MRIRRLVLLAALFLAACGTGATSSGDPAAGQQLFSGAKPIAGGNGPACETCHSVEPGMPGSIGQNLSNIGNRAATTVPGQAAEEYLRTAITDPDAFLSGGYQEGIMYRGYARDLTPQEISDLVAYMLTLKSGQDD